MDTKFNLNSLTATDLSAGGKTRMVVQARSEGDGMENVPCLETTPPSSRHATTNRISQTCPSSFGSSTIKRKEPKFVPYEPYKAAVSPIVISVKNISKNSPTRPVIDPMLIKPANTNGAKKPSSAENSWPKHKLIDVLPAKQKEVSSDVIIDQDLSAYCAKCSLHIADHDMQSAKSVPNGTEMKGSVHCGEPKEELEKKIEHLTKEKSQLEAELNIQVKVNADLKKLLVASLGEDMQTKVQYMSEDKAKLGEHVLYYSQQLMQSSEEMDKLSVQCDLWKAKFEASSLLVRELVGWKTALSRKFSQATDAINCLMKEQEEISEQLSEVFSILHNIQAAFDPTSKLNFPCANNPWNVLQLASATRSLSEDIKFRLLGSGAVRQQELGKRAVVFAGKTHGEQSALEVLSDIKNLPDIAKSEVSRCSEMGTGSQACSVLPHACSREPTVNCCRQCSGEMQLL